MSASQPPLSATEPLSDSHRLAAFDCGQHISLNDWLKRYALANQKNGSARTFVVCRGNIVVGYYSLAASSVVREEAPGRVAQGLAHHPVPVVLLARLAVDTSEQGRGLGKALLKDALIRILSASDNIGIRAVLVHAIDEPAKRFYEQFGFVASPVQPMHLMMLMKDLRRTIALGASRR